MRTPLTAISLQAESLDEHGLDDNQKQQLKNCEKLLKDSEI